MLDLRKLKIRKEDLVRTGFMKKHNILVDEVIHDVELVQEEITGGTSGSKTYLRFHYGNGQCKDIECCGSSSVGGLTLPIPATQVSYINAEIENVQQALDSLLYKPPELSITSSVPFGYREVGDGPLSFDLTATGEKKSRDMDFIEIEGPNGNVLTDTSIEGDPVATQNFSESDVAAPGIDFNSTGSYRFRARLRDVGSGSTLVIQDIFLNYTFPIYQGSLTFNAHQEFLDNGIAGIETQMNTRVSNLTKALVPEPTTRIVDHGTNARFTYFMFPKSYGKLTSIVDDSLGLPYGFESFSGLNQFADWKEIEFTLTTPQWSTDYILYVSKTQKKNLTIRYNF